MNPQKRARFLTSSMLLLSSFFFGVAAVRAAAGQSLGDFKLSYGVNYGQGARKDKLSSNKESAPAKFALTLSSRLEVRVEAASVKSKQTEGQSRNTGAGDTVLGSSFVLLDEDPKKGLPGLSLDYSAKVPTASKGLGTGEVDHQLLGIISRAFTKRLYGEIDGGVYIAGVPKGTSTKSGLVSLIGSSGIGHQDDKGFSWRVLEEVDLGTAAPGSPTSLVSTTLLSRKLNPDWTLVGGVNAGITPYDPKFGLTFGVKYSGSFKKKGL